MMYIKEFERLKVQDVRDIKTLSIGEYFLTPALEEQKTTRKVGETVTVYVVTEIRPNGNMIYAPQYLVLENN